MCKISLLRITTIAYGIAIIIISAIVHYLVIPGIENCNSMSGIVSTYTSKDYSSGCQILLNVQNGAVTAEIGGAAIIAYGALQKPKSK